MGKLGAGTHKAEIEEQWHARLARRAAGKSSVAEFCKLESITQGAFYRWQARFQQQSVAPAAFINLGAAPCAGVRKAVPHVGIEETVLVDVHLDLGNGVSLHIVRR